MTKILSSILLIPLLLISLTEIHQVIEAGLDEFTDYERPGRTCNCIGCSMAMHGNEQAGEAQMCDITQGEKAGEKAHHCTMSMNQGDGDRPSVCSCNTKNNKQPHILYNTPDKNALITIVKPMGVYRSSILFREFLDPDPQTAQNDIFHPPRA